MKKRTILGLCLSIFSLILFSCGIADSSRGNASFTLDTAKIAQRSVQSANFSELSEEEIFLKYAEYVYFDLSAIVHYEIDGEATDQTFDLWSMNGKEAYELVEKLQNMSGEDEEAYFVEKFSSKTLTITDLPIGKDATFRLKILQKVGFNIDLSEYGLSESETKKEEYLAISKKPVTARIGEDTDIKIVIGEYDSSLDWEKTEEPEAVATTEIPWSFSATIPENYSASFKLAGGAFYIYKKTNGTWEICAYAEIDPSGDGFTANGYTISGLIPIEDEATVTGNGSVYSASTESSSATYTIEGSGTASCFSVGDTIAITMEAISSALETTDDAAEYDNVFLGWSKEITIAESGNDFDMGELTFEKMFAPAPAPETLFGIQISSYKKITPLYATIKIYTADGSVVLTKEFTFESIIEISTSEYGYSYIIGASDLTSDIPDETELSAEITLYSDEAKTEVFYTGKTSCDSDYFYNKGFNLFIYEISESGDTTSSGESDTTSSGKAGTYWDNSNGLPEPVLFVNYNGTEYKSTDSTNALTVTADGTSSITFWNKYLGDDNEWHYYGGMIFNCTHDDSEIPSDAVKWYLNDMQIYQAQITGDIRLTIGETDYNNGGTGVGAAELKTGENTIKVEATYNDNTKTAEMTFIVN